MSKCLVTGTFDPITLGHEELIKKAIATFDEVSVAVLINPDKTPLFSEEERVSMIEETFGDKVEAFSFSGLAVDAAKCVGASALVRGVRADADIPYEIEMADYNRAWGLETVFFFASEKLKDVSATAARELLKKGIMPDSLMSERAKMLAVNYLEAKNG